MARHTPPEVQRQMVARWQASGEPVSTFARRHGIGHSTFRLWIARHPSAEASPKAVTAFLQVVGPAVSATPTGLSVAVDGHELRFSTVPPPVWFGAMLREFSRC